MTKERYETLALHDLKEIAKARGMKGTSALKKADLIEALLRQDEKDAKEMACAAGRLRLYPLRQLHAG